MKGPLERITGVLIRSVSETKGRDKSRIGQEAPRKVCAFRSVRAAETVPTFYAREEERLL